MANETWKHDESIRSALEQFKADARLTDRALGRLLIPVWSPTRVNKYLNLDKPGKTPEADMALVQDSARKFLRHRRRHSEFRSTLFETPESREIAGVMNMVSNAGQIGVVYGPAGRGKTCGAHLYARDKADVIVITAKKYAGGASAVTRLLFTEINDPEAARHPDTAADAWDGRMSYSLFIEDRLRARPRKIIVDMAHRLSVPALELLCDLHDETKTPIGLFGTKDLLHLLLRDSQIWSRVGIFHELHGDLDDAERDHEEKAEVARKLLTQICGDEAAAALQEEGVELLSGSGHARNLRMHATLARTLKDEMKCEWAEAWQEAAAKLIKPMPARLQRQSGCH